MVYFRKAGIDSTDELVRLWSETFRQAYKDVHKEEDILAYCTQNYTVESAQKVLSNDQSDCIIAYRNEKPVGYYVIQRHPCPINVAGSSLELKQIYILAEEYGTGLGKALYEHAVENAKTKNNQWFWLCISDINFRAQSFYKKLEFKAIGKGPKLIVGDDFLSSTIMICNL
jgi:diamine N-acetyltransferase